MLADVWKVARSVVKLADDLQRYHVETKEIRQDLLKLTLLVQRLSDEIEMMKQKSADEREKMELRLRIWQLEIEKKQLPPVNEEGKQRRQGDNR